MNGRKKHWILWQKLIMDAPMSVSSIARNDWMLRFEFFRPFLPIVLVALVSLASARTEGGEPRDPIGNWEPPDKSEIPDDLDLTPEQRAEMIDLHERVKASWATKTTIKVYSKFFRSILQTQDNRILILKRGENSKGNRFAYLSRYSIRALSTPLLVSVEET
jgi:hypothetical protein